MDVPSANFPHEIKPLTNSINLLNKDIAFSISPYFADRDLINLCLTSKELYSIFNSSLKKRLIPYFLKYVVEGRLDKVEEILNKNKKLVFLQGDITDPSGRLFTRITAFQYAIWALDKERWELILKYLPETGAYDQLMALELERLDITQVHGTQLNFAPLLGAYQKYIDNYEPWTPAQCEACWCEEVGGAQRQMPAWFVYVFCEEGSDKAWPTNDFKKNFTRDPKHLRWWFDQEYNKGKLGVKWAARRAGPPGGAAGAMWGYLSRGSLRCATDQQHLSLCWEERMSCRSLLSDYLKRMAETKNSPTQLNKK